MATASALARTRFAACIVLATILAGAVGAGVGAFAARGTLAENIWSAAFLVPAWLALELLMELAAAGLGAWSRAARRATRVAVVLGFYAAWLYFRR